MKLYLLRDTTSLRTCGLVLAVLLSGSLGADIGLGQTEHLPPPAGDAYLPVQDAVVPPAGYQPLAPDGYQTVPPSGNALDGPIFDIASEQLPPIRNTWYNPLSLIGPDWDGSFEIGINGTSGNADSISVRNGADLSRETDRSKWDVKFVYAKTEADQVITQHNAMLRSRWDYKFGEPRWSWYNQLGLEYDEFRDFDLRLALTTGLAYHFVDTESTKLAGRFGAGASREFGGPNEEWTPEANFGIDFERQLTKRQKLTSTVDYYPAWDDFSDFRLVSNFSWELLLDEAANMSLKLSAIDRYDSTPEGAKANDIDYALLLIWSLK